LRRRGKKEYYLVYDRKMCQIAAYAPEEIPLNREAITERSIYFFDDPSPCFLHESAVKLRMLEELRRELENHDRVMAVEALPAQLRGYLELRTDMCFIEYYTDKFQE